MTLVGRVRVSRAYYHCPRCRAGHCPRDTTLGVTAGDLSRGTVEQLYVCVRLGLVRAFASRGLRLPLLLDDVCVNFDPARAEATAGVLADFAREHQVLLFTCHPQTVERLLAVEPACRVVELEQARSRMQVA